MPTFTYKALTSSGETVRGAVEAPDRKQVIRQLLTQNIRPVSVNLSDKPVEELDETVDFYRSRSAGRWRARLPKIGGGSSLGLNFLRKLLELLSSGMPMGDAVKLLSQRLSDPQLKSLATGLWRQLSEGRTLAAAMSGMNASFSPSTIHLIEAGEATGNLAPILRKIVAYMEESAQMRGKVLNSLAYPAFICLVAFGVVLFFLYFLLPKIEGMMETLGGEMQWFAALLINGSHLALKLGPVAILLLLAGGFGLLQWRKTPKGRKVTDYWLLRLPFIGKILLASEIFQCSSLLATLLDSGINTTEALRLTEKTIRNSQMQSKFSLCRRQVQEGVPLAGAFQRTRFMPGMAIDILTVGENTGNLVNSLGEISQSQRRELTASLNLLTALISSGALVFAFVLVTVIALSIILSVFQVSNSLTG